MCFLVLSKKFMAVWNVVHGLFVPERALRPLDSAAVRLPWTG